MSISKKMITFALLISLALVGVVSSSLAGENESFGLSGKIQSINSIAGTIVVDGVEMQVGGASAIYPDPSNASVLGSIRDLRAGYSVHVEYYRTDTTPYPVRAVYLLSKYSSYKMEQL